MQGYSSGRYRGVLAKVDQDHQKRLFLHQVIDKRRPSRHTPDIWHSGLHSSRMPEGYGVPEENSDLAVPPTFGPRGLHRRSRMYSLLGGSMHYT